MRLRELMRLLAEEAQSLKSKYIGVEHALLVLMKTGGLESKALTTAGADYQLLREYVKRRFAGLENERVYGPTEELKRLLDDVIVQQKRNKDTMTYLERLLMNLLVSDTIAKEMLIDTNVNPQQVYMLLDNYISMGNLSEENTDTPNLAKYGEDLVKTSLKKIDGVIAVSYNTSDAADEQ